MDKIKYIFENLKMEIIYIVITVIYLIFLNSYNHLLVSKYIINDYINMLFDNYVGILIYFICAIFLVGIAVGFIIHKKNMLKTGSLGPEKVFISLISIFLNFIMIITIIIFINNPILQCILFGMVILIGLVGQ